MMNRNYFLIIYNRKHDILVLNKKSLNRWEIPKVSSSKDTPLYKLAEDYMTANFDVKFKIIGRSNIVDRYEWPKELVSITGKSGEEHFFIFVKLESHFSHSSIKEKSDIKGYDILNYNEACERVIFKNHRKVLWNVLEDLKKKDELVPSLENDGRKNKNYEEDEHLRENSVHDTDAKNKDDEPENFIEPERYR